MKARYFFHIFGEGVTNADEERTALFSPEVAVLQAAVTATELARDGDTITATSSQGGD